MSRRARHLAGLEPWASVRPQYALKLGSSPIGFDCLTDSALSDLRTRISRDVRSERARRR